jgi:hypothetical protein
MIQSKLFVPGSIEVSPETLQTMAQSRSKRLIFACLKSRAVDGWLIPILPLIQAKMSITGFPLPSSVA